MSSMREERGRRFSGGSLSTGRGTGVSIDGPWASQGAMESAVGGLHVNTEDSFVGKGSSEPHRYASPVIGLWGSTEQKRHLRRREHTIAREATMLTDDPIMLAAASWFGYGRWNAPYWFIGPEPGMAKDEGDNLLARCRAWQILGSGELLDNLEHHRAFNHMKHHTRTIAMKVPINGRSMRPPTQSTWRQLIRLYLAFKGDRIDNDSIGDYQCTECGSANGDTCLPELSSLAANGFRVERDRIKFRESRTVRLREMVIEHRPRFVVVYGGGKGLQAFWNYIACGTYEPNPYVIETIAGWEVGFNFGGQTKFVRTAHPVKAGGAAPPEDYWLGIAARLRSAF